MKNLIKLLLRENIFKVLQRLLHVHRKRPTKTIGGECDPVTTLEKLKSH
jgi:hypothetical protein